MNTLPASNEPFQYDDLNLERPAFRLFRLFKGDGTRLECELFQAFLDERDTVLPYEAISYTWGITDLSDSIITNGRRLDITASLYLALMQLRYKDQDRILWADGVCINQSNPKERGHQVQQMGYIYRQADRVVFWLGLATYETNVFMDSLQLLHQESLRRPCGGWKLNDYRWKEVWDDILPALRAQHSDLLARQRSGLETLLDRPWFRRVWILQEVANARAAVICCGLKSVPSRLFALMPILLGVRPVGLCQAVLDIMPGPSRKETWWAERRDLYFLLQSFSASQSSEPRDAIFALLGLSTDANDPAVLAPDYEKPTRELLSHVSKVLYFCDINREKVNVESVPEMVSRLMQLNSAALGELIRLSKWEEVSVILDRGELTITGDTIRAAVDHEHDGAKLLRHVFQNMRDKGSMTYDAAEQLALRGDPETMRLLLKLKFEGSKVTSRALAFAALNEAHGPKMVESLVQRGRKPRVTKEVLIATVLNTVSGAAVREQLISSSASMSSSEILEAIATMCTEQAPHSLTYRPCWLLEELGHTAAFPVHDIVAFTAQLLRHCCINEAVWTRQFTLGADLAGRTVLSHACEVGEWQLASTLAERVGNVDVADKTGRTHLSCAAGAGRLGMVRGLLRCGADAGKADDNGLTPRMWAERGGCDKVVAVLVQRGGGGFDEDEVSLIPTRE